MGSFKPSPLILGFVLVFLFARPTLAFGAGNIAGISSVEGQNWRHGDIEDTLLQILMARTAGGKKFDKLMVTRVYFGNWLRDYSQAIDVGTVKSVSAEAIRLLICVLGFLTFGFGSREFEVTAERLGTYRPEDHIDNPKDYADNVDARQYDRRLRGPVDERVELAIDPETGLKNYIANERAGIMTSAYHVRRLFTKCIELGRSYGRNHRKEDLYEALRLLGTGLHCLEDFLAHSNYTELALIELGERDVFPHVGRRTLLRLPGARHEVYPCVTGTFGGVDFLHSVAGEVSDKLTQNEIDTLEGTLENTKSSDTSILANLLDNIPDGIFGGSDKKQKMQNIQDSASAAQMQQMSVSPREPEEYTRYIQQIFAQVMPAIEFHDEIMQSISEAIEKIPILPKLIEQVEDQLSIFVFSILAPFVVPVINQVKNELRTGSSEIIESSKNEQHIVFNDDHCSDPTHSMLSKDHFSNILNEIAGQTASKVVAWVVPQIMEAWDNDNVDVPRTLNRIIHGVLHHPAQREYGDDGARDARMIMFNSVAEWWNAKDEREKNDFRRKLSRDGVLRGENHKEGVHDTGHGCGKPIGMHKQFGSGGNTLEDKIVNSAADAIVGGLTGGISNIVQSETGIHLPTKDKPKLDFGGGQGGGGGGGGGLGGLLGAVTGGLLGQSFTDQEKTSYESSGRTADGGYSETVTQYGREGDRYAQAEFTETQYPGGGSRSEYSRYEQREGGGRHHGREPQGYGYEERSETRPSYGGGYEERTERRWEDNGGQYRQEEEVRNWGGDRRGERREHNYGNRYEENTASGWGGDRREESYGNRYEENTSSGWDGGRREENYGNRYQENASSGWGGGRRDEGYGGGRRDESYGGGRRDESYGGGYEERRNEGNSGGWGEVLGGGGGGGGILGEIARTAEEAFEGDDDERRERRGGWGF
ncbi:hypothetical protein VTK73DRAFT_6546 [Phialemonium thermophilum]|uniref:Nima-interacting protein n=1 Tax=Phialemonium thermophilum TaxID=223376 RepID=A0ABR3XVC5_9PEZI